MQTQITPFLLFNTEAEEAARYYVSVFNGKLLNVYTYPENMPMPAGTVLTATFEILGMTLTALNWGQEAKFSEATSFSVKTQTQEDTDRYWNTLTADGGEEGPCGWLKDKYGLSWQIVPEIMPRLLKDPNPKKAAAVMQAMMKMKKIIVKDIQAAYNQA